MLKTVVLATFMMVMIATSLTVSSQAYGQNYTVPTWVKKNTKWWHEGSVGDKDFVQGIQYLIQKGIMKVGPPPTSSKEKCTGYYC